MQVIGWLSIVLGGIYLALGYTHYNIYGHVNASAQALILFLIINILICYWELALTYRYEYISKSHTKRMKDGYYAEKNAAKREPIIIVKHAGLSEVFTLKFAADIWVDYSHFDSSYADKTTFGYCIDVGNGHITLIPSVLLAWSIVQPIFSAKVTGIMGLLVFYQTWYGTVLYFYQFVNNHRYKSLQAWEVFGVVGVSNGIWIFFPMLGFYTSVRLIMDESFAVWQ